MQRERESARKTNAKWICCGNYIDIDFHDTFACLHCSINLQNLHEIIDVSCKELFLLLPIKVPCKAGDHRANMNYVMASLVANVSGGNLLSEFSSLYICTKSTWVVITRTISLFLVLNCETEHLFCSPSV